MPRIIGLLALVLATAGCADSGCVVLQKASPLLAEPYPLGYPSTRPLPNRVLDTLAPGPYRYAGVHDGKDYRVYELTPGGGQHGYLLDESNLGACTAADADRASGA